jgi:UDP-N-acetylglucosamine 2-epimerase (non-hydrolysing)
MGTRPEVIKLAPVVRALAAAAFEPVVCATGQHRELLDQALEHLAIRPHVRLDVMRPGSGPAEVAAQIMRELTDVLDSVRPALMIVQGDTTTALAAGLTAAYRGVAVAHVEAGLRTGDRSTPFPEELHRRMLATVASFHFAPTPLARENLLREGVPESSVWVTGNTGIDALHWVLRSADAAPTVEGRRHVLVTAHRRESISSGLRATAAAVRTLARRRPDVDFTWPVHLNPGVRRALMPLRGHGMRNLHVCEPLPYPQFVRRLAASSLVVTDSGGVQEEAPALGVPVVVVSDKTARQEGLDHGGAVAVGTEHDRIVNAVEAALDGARPSVAPRTLYGDGLAADRIAAVLAERLASRPVVA